MSRPPRAARILLPLLAAACAACADLGGNPLVPDEEKPVNPCDPLPANGTPETATVIPFDTEATGAYCRAGGPQRLWWKVEGQFEPLSTYRLTVRWERGTEAEDLDFRLGVLNGGDVRFTLEAGSCSNAAGQDEDCVVSIPDGNAVTELYVRATPGSLAQAEVFHLKVAPYSPPGMP